MTISDIHMAFAPELRRRDRGRYAACMFAPADRRVGLLTLYAFNLEISSIWEKIREPLAGRIRLQWWRDSIGDLYDGEPVGARHPLFPPLVQTIAGYHLPRDLFDALIDAHERDMEGEEDPSPPDMSTLLSHAEAISAPLATLGLGVMGVDGAVERDAVLQVALAYALTGLLRAAPLHEARGRRFLPAGDPATVVAEVRGVAEGLVQAARKVCGGKCERRVWPLLMPAILIDPVLKLLWRNGHNVRDPRVALAPLPVARLVLGYATGRF
ncbi:MAG: squalene/phytoene synthase family protein [Alphaproteobacteria bacterium]